MTAPVHPLGVVARGLRLSFRARFLVRLAREVDLAFARRVDRSFRALTREVRSGVSDERARTHLVFTALALATYREAIAQAQDRDAAFALTKKVFLDAARSPPWITLVVRMGVRPWAPGEAFARIAANFIPRGRRLFGTGFEYRPDRETSEHAFIGIRQCLYHRYFSDHGAPELTQIFCAWDSAWADELAKPKYGVVFERPTRLSAGDDYCRFQFTQIRPRRS